MQEWRLLAACRDTDPDAPFANPESVEAKLFAERVCGTCPVRDECLDWALGRNDAGIWGGLTPDERGVEKQARAVEQRIAHGTNAGYYQHRRAHQSACMACRLAHNAHSARWHAENADRVPA